MKIGFVFTNYNNASFTCAAVESLARSRRWGDCAVVVVDNASGTDDVERLIALIDNIEQLNDVREIPDLVRGDSNSV